MVARPPGRVCAQTPVAVKRVASLTCLDILPLCGGVVGVEVGLAGGIGKSWEVGIMDWKMPRVGRVGGIGGVVGGAPMGDVTCSRVVKVCD